jgi:hypothetical protein
MGPVSKGLLAEGSSTGWKKQKHRLVGVGVVDRSGGLGAWAGGMDQLVWVR